MAASLAAPDPSRVAVAWALIVSARERRIECVDPKPFAKLAYPNSGPDLAVDRFARIRFNVTVSSRSGNWPPSVRIAVTGLEWRSAG